MISASVYWPALTRYTGNMDLQWIVKLIADGLVVPVVLIGAYSLIKLVPNKEKYQVYSQVLMAGFLNLGIMTVISFLAFVNGYVSVIFGATIKNVNSAAVIFLVFVMWALLICANLSMKKTAK